MSDPNRSRVGVARHHQEEVRATRVSLLGRRDIRTVYSMRRLTGGVAVCFAVWALLAEDSAHASATPLARACSFNFAGFASGGPGVLEVDGGPYYVEGAKLTRMRCAIKQAKTKTNCTDVGGVVMLGCKAYADFSDPELESFEGAWSSGPLADLPPMVVTDSAIFNQPEPPSIVICTYIWWSPDLDGAHRFEIKVDADNDTTNGYQCGG